MNREQEDFILEQSREWMLNHTAEKSRKEEIEFEQEETKDNISDCLAKQKLGLAEELNKMGNF